MTFSLLVVTTFGCNCTYFSPIVGKWQDIKTQDNYEFTRDGSFIIESGGYIFTGKYELIGDNVVRLSLEGFAGEWASLFGADAYQYTVSGNIMTLKGAGSTFILTKHKYNVGDKITRTSWTDGHYLYIVDIEIKDGELMYVVSSSPTGTNLSYISVSKTDDNPDFYLIN